jgi:hypothetical protein
MLGQKAIEVFIGGIALKNNGAEVVKTPAPFSQIHLCFPTTIFFSSLPLFSLRLSFLQPRHCLLLKGCGEDEVGQPAGPAYIPRGESRLCRYQKNVFRVCLFEIRCVT